MQLSSVRPSVCPTRPLQAAAAGLLLWARRTGDIDRLQPRPSLRHACNTAGLASTSSDATAQTAGQLQPLQPPHLPHPGQRLGCSPACKITTAVLQPDAPQQPRRSTALSSKPRAVPRCQLTSKTDRELVYCAFQRARMARIQMNNMAALKNFIQHKRRTMLRNYDLPIVSEDEEYREQASGEPGDAVQQRENTYQSQHNHLLSCLEQTTVRTLIRRMTMT